jgi:hypothetical protein
VKYGGGRLAFLKRLGFTSALQITDSREQDADPGLHCGRTGCCRNITAFGQHGFGLSQVADLKQDSAQQPEQVGTQPQVSRAEGEGAFQPGLPFLEQSAGQPEAAQRMGQPGPGLATTVGEYVVKGGAEVVLLAQQHRQLAFAFGELQVGFSVPPPGLPGLARLGQAVRSVLVDCPQQPVPGAAPPGLGDN